MIEWLDEVFTAEKLRMFFVTSISSFISFYTPTADLVVAMICTFVFNIFCGIRADNITAKEKKKCQTFNFKKFRSAIAELCVYLLIIEVVFTVMVKLGDADAAQIVIKTITYLFIYVYVQNSLKNLIATYPKNIALRLVYHLIRFEIMRATPAHLQAIVERLNRESGDDPEKAEKVKTKKKDNENPKD